MGILRPRRWRPGVAGVVLLACIVGTGEIKTSTGPAQGVFPAAGMKTAGEEIRVATYNVHSGIGADGKLDLGRTAEALAGFDVVGLNEVRGPAQGEDQATLLGKKLGMEALFVPTERQWWHAHFGNGLLLGVKGGKWERRPLEGSWGRGMRNVLVTEIPTARGNVRVFTTHIDRGADRERQLREVIGLFLECPEQGILMGDFNTEGSDPQLAALRKKEGVVDCLTVALGGRLPSVNIDWIYIKGLKLKDAGLKENGASDHPLAWAAIELSGPSTRSSQGR